MKNFFKGGSLFSNDPSQDKTNRIRKLIGFNSMNEMRTVELLKNTYYDKCMRFRPVS